MCHCSRGSGSHLALGSPDVIHGILVSGTNVNTMVVPGYVSQVHTVFRTTGDLLMPCHEFCGLGHSQMLARVRVVPAEQFRPDAEGRAAVMRNRDLVLAHSGSPLRCSRLAAVLGVWQMWVRSPLHAPYANPQNYFLSVTAHGVSMAYVLTTFFIMGFGYFVAETALGRKKLPGDAMGLGGVRLGVIGTLLAGTDDPRRRASVLSPSTRR